MRSPWSGSHRRPTDLTSHAYPPQRPDVTAWLRKTAVLTHCRGEPLKELAAQAGISLRIIYNWLALSGSAIASPVTAVKFTWRWLGLCRGLARQGDAHPSQARRAMRKKRRVGLVVGQSCEALIRQISIDRGPTMDPPTNLGRPKEIARVDGIPGAWNPGCMESRGHAVGGN